MPSRFQRLNISTKQNFLSNKKSGSTPLSYGLGAKKPILAMFWRENKRSKSSTCPIIFHISFLKNPLFDADLFSRTFDMESPFSE